MDTAVMESAAEAQAVNKLPSPCHIRQVSPNTMKVLEVAGIKTETEQTVNPGELKSITNMIFDITNYTYSTKIHEWQQHESGRRIRLH